MSYKNIAITFLLLHTAQSFSCLRKQPLYSLAVGFILLAKLRELHHHELLLQTLRTHLLFPSTVRRDWLFVDWHK